jgi:hypothetical protein
VPLGWREDDAVERGHEPVKALELKMLGDVLSFINVRLAGYARCSPDRAGEPI